MMISSTSWKNPIIRVCLLFKDSINENKKYFEITTLLFCPELEYLNILNFDSPFSAMYLQD